MAVAPHHEDRVEAVAPEATLKQRYEQVKQRIAEAAARAGRRAGDIVLVAVTKNASVDEIRQLVELGHVDFGENRVQNLVQRAAQINEYLSRQQQLRTERGRRPQADIRWHMIGHLQRNKVRKVLNSVRLIHSVDSLRLAEEIQIGAARFEQPVEVLVQVNTSGEKSKFGCAPAAVRHLLDQIDTMLNLRARGMMCMAPQSERPEDSRLTFQRCRELFDDLRAEGVGGERFNLLSMGMSSDFEVGIECGSNIVRIGTAIFGEGTPAPDDDSGESFSDLPHDA
jgi:pyridoxal phosphate enzyme (YggS family)